MGPVMKASLILIKLGELFHQQPGHVGKWADKSFKFYRFWYRFNNQLCMRRLWHMLLGVVRGAREDMPPKILLAKKFSEQCCPGNKCLIDLRFVFLFRLRLTSLQYY